MRNLVTSVLPPFGHVVIAVKPPIGVGEQPIVITMRGAHTATIDRTNPASILIVNPTNKVAPIAFFVGPIGRKQWLAEGLRRLQLLLQQKK